MSNTAFGLGVYLNDNPNVSNEAPFEADYNAFVQTMGGARPQFMDTYTDTSNGFANYASNSAWDAQSFAATGNNYIGPGSGVVPVIGMPIAVNASNVDQDYKNDAAGVNDAAFEAVVDNWAAAGYKTIQLRLDYEFNGNWMAWSPGNAINSDGSNLASVQADYIAAWQHVADVVHAEGAKDGITVQTVWNPCPTDSSTIGNIANWYPGDNAVDVISSDDYSPTWAIYSQLQQQPGGLEHYWQYGLGTGVSFNDIVQLAIQHNKPFSISETGAGLSAGDPPNSGPRDNPEFVTWLANALHQYQQQGLDVQNVDIWDAYTGQYTFTDGQAPQEAAAWDQYFGAGSGTSTPTPSPSSPSPAPAPTPEPTPAPSPTPASSSSPSSRDHTPSSWSDHRSSSRDHTPSSWSGDTSPSRSESMSFSSLDDTPSPTANAVQLNATIGTDSFPLDGSGTSGNVSHDGDTFSLHGANAAVVLGGGSQTLSFLQAGSVNVTGGSATATVKTDGGTNTFSAGTGTLVITGGSGANTFDFLANSGKLTITDFNSNNDTLQVASSLHATMQEQQTSAGSLITFGNGQQILLKGVANFDTGHISWT